MKKMLDKIKEINKLEVLKTVSMVLLVSMYIGNTGGMFVYAAGPGWGQNAFSFIQETVQYIALAIVVVYAAKFIAKRAWVQFGGFVLLASIVLFLIGAPESLKSVGTTIWNLIFN